MMPRFVAVVVMLFMQSLLLSGTVQAGSGARFDSRTSVLSLPELIVDETTVIYDLQLQLLPGRPWSLFSVGTTRAGTSYPLTTKIVDFPGYLTKDSVFRLENGDLWSGCAAFSANAPLAEAAPTVTIYQTAADEYRLQFANSAVACTPAPLQQFSAAAASAIAFAAQPTALAGQPGEVLQFIVGGGTPPYTAVAANPAILQVRTPLFNGPGGSAQLTAQTGETALLLSDAAGNLLVLPVTNSSPSVPPSAALSISPDLVEAGNGERLVFAIAGGVPPYQVSSSNAALLAVRAISADTQAPRATVTVEALAGSGNARILAVDASGATVSATITLKAAHGPASAKELSLTPQAVEAHAGERLTLAIAGGVAPYQVTSSQPGLIAVRTVEQDAAVARAQVTLDVLGSRGSAIVSVVDAAGAAVVTTVTVVAPTGPLSPVALSLSPASLKVSPGETATLAIAGGVAPYQVTSSQPGLIAVRELRQDAQAARASVTLAVLGATGTVQITVVDAQGNTASVPVSIAASGPVSTEPLRLSPASLVGRAGETLVIGIAGGAAPYRIALSHPGLMSIVGLEEDASSARASVTLRLADAVGEASITVLDANGTAISAPVSIVPGLVSAQALTVRPGSITAAYGSATSFAIAGGAAPYTVTSSNNAVVVVRRIEQNSQAASATVGLYISGRGSATVAVTDASGHSIEVWVVGE